MHEGRDIRLTFDDVSDLYERARPTYPVPLFDQLFELLPAAPHVLEMGPGTGQATELLLDRGASVTAVEFGPRLAQALTEKFRGRDDFAVINALFEDAEVSPHSFDCVVAATAYHWVEATAKVERPLELLRPGGALAVIDLIQVDSAADRGYFKAVQPIYDRYQSPSSEREPRNYDTAMPPVVEPLEKSGRYASIRVYRYPWDQTYTSAEYRDLLLTYSGTQMMPEPERSKMVDALIRVVDHDFEGTITRPLCATLTVAVPAPLAAR